MDQRIINNKYEVLDTIYSDQYQNVYICKKADEKDDEKYILNEFLDRDITDAVESSFSHSGDGISKNILDTFEIEDTFYVLFPISKGTALEEYLSKHSLTIAEKMFLTEQLLKAFIEIDNSVPLIQYTLCDLNNMSVIMGKYIDFNNLYCFDKNNLNVSFDMVSKRLGHIICCIFANNPQGDIEKDADAIPPAILPIVKKALEGSYDSTNQIYEDFKNTLLYTTFLDNQSLDESIRKNIKKAKGRYVVYWPRFIASLLILAALIGGGFWFVKKSVPASAPNDVPSNSQSGENTAPVAAFSISINKVYSGDEVTFVDKSSDSDTGDAIKSRLWTIEKNGMVLFNSEEKSLNYVFTETGDYVVSLVVEDSKGAKSEPFSHIISVLDKPEIPEDDVEDDDHMIDMK